ncbi:MAG: hypothetical protein NC099_05105 [Corallococcus sp.]|nr:hypothetical protein [Bacillota bacterium]MCM1534014.1 hypothetical protein [Corallococcus sp.]
MSFKRGLYTVAVSAIFLIITSVVGFLFSFVPTGMWETFGIASAVFAVGIILSLTVRRRKSVKYVVIFINAIAMGIYLRSWYIDRKFSNPLWMILAVAVLATAYLLLIVAVVCLIKNPKARLWTAVAFVMVSVVAYILLVILTTTSWVSTLGFFGLLQIGFAFSLFSKEESLVASWQIASYTVALCAVIILVIALGGDGLDGLFDGAATAADSQKKNNDGFGPLDK